MSFTFRNRIAVVAALLLAAAAWAGQYGAGDKFPDLSGFGLEGSLPELDGKVVIVDFWASWCGPCKASFPVFDELQAKYGADGLVIVAVSVDEDRKAMDHFLEKQPVSFTVVRDAKHKLVASAGIKSMPTSFVIGRDGTIRSVHNGFKGEETRQKLVEEIEALLK